MDFLFCLVIAAIAVGYIQYRKKNKVNAAVVEVPYKVEAAPVQEEALKVEAPVQEVAEPAKPKTATKKKAKTSTIPKKPRKPKMTIAE